MRTLIRLLTTLSFLMAPGLLAANESSDGATVEDHRIEFHRVARLSYRLASFAEDLSYRAFNLGNVPEDHRYEVRQAADRLHNAASDLYRETRRLSGPLGVEPEDHREDEVRGGFMEVAEAYNYLQAVANYYQIVPIARVYSQLSYAVRGI